MLLRFSVTNYLSIRDEAELSFVATAFKEQADQVLASRYTKHGVLPVIAIYGANASGKSNILDALNFFRRMVLWSFKRTEPGMPHRPFKLDEESASKCSNFILDFVIDDVRYQYGVTHSSERVEEEWLYSFPKTQKQVLFSRNLSEAQEFYFGRGLPGANRQIQSITRPNSLFLSVAATSGHPIISRIYQFFEKSLIIRMASNIPPGGIAPELLEEDESLTKEVVEHLALADTGIADLRFKTEKLPTEIAAELKNFVSALRKITTGQVDSNIAPDTDEMKKVELGHTSIDGKVRYIDYDDESLGTRYLFTILPSVLIALRKGQALILDEITTSLHTLLVRKLVMMFQNHQLNRTGAQLVFSTHDTNLLAPGVLRRDEVLLVEKSTSGVSSYYPLTDIKTKNTDNIERGYIQGRFGAIPFIRFE